MRMLGMGRRSLSAILAVMIGSSAFLSLVSIVPEGVEAKTLYVGGSGPGNYTLVQAAIVAANPGDTIFVYNGTYFDQLTVDKPLNIAGEDNENTTIINHVTGDVVRIVSDWVNISGLNITVINPVDGQIGILLDNVMNCTISNNSVFDIDIGMALVGSHNNTISGNIHRYNRYGLIVSDSTYNSIIGNTVAHGYEGISLWNSGNTILESNDISEVEASVLDISYSDDVALLNNTFFSGGGVSISVGDRNTVIGNTFSEVGDALTFYESHYNLIEGNEVIDCNMGLLLQRSDFNSFLSNSLNGTEYGGLLILYSMNTLLKNNAFSGDGVVIFGKYPHEWNRHDIDASNVVDGKPIYYWKNATGGKIPSDAGQVILANCENVVVENLNISGLTMGIMLGFSKGTLVANVTGNSHRLWPIVLSHSQGNKVINCTFLNNMDGIEFIDSDNNIIEGNNVSHNGYVGIFVDSSHGNSFISNEVHFNEGSGIHLEWATHNTLTQNNLSRNMITISGDKLEEHNTHVMDVSNIVNGEPLYYWKNQTGGVVPYDAGQVILANCTGTVVENQVIHNGSGIDVAFSTDTTIANNTLSEDSLGIDLYITDYGTVENNTVTLARWSAVSVTRSNNNTVTRNYLTGAGISLTSSANNNRIMNNSVINGEYDGVSVYGIGNIVENNSLNNNEGVGVSVRGDENIISSNTIANNGQDGVYLSYSENNLITLNDIKSNGGNGTLLYTSRYNTISANDISYNDKHGIRIDEVWTGLGSNNTIYHNNIEFNNHFQAQGYDSTYYNQWDDGYPSGGNYWSDYTGSDSNFDGIGDFPYDIDGGSNLDRYPLTNQAPYFTPSDPLNLIAIPGNQHVYLSWDTPLTNGGLVVLGYSIYRGNASGDETFLSEVTSEMEYTDTGLTNGQTYYYQVTAFNFLGEGPKSNEATATPYNILPTCQINTPISGETVNGTYLITGFASDPDGLIEKVEVKIDNGDWQTAVGHTLWYLEWDTLNISDGEHTIYAKSFDGENVSTMAIVIAVVDNPSPPSDQDEDWWIWVLISVLIAIVAVFGLIVYFVLLRKKSEAVEDLEVEPPPE